MHRTLASLKIALLLLCAAHAAVAQDKYPSKPVRLVVPFLAGAAPDSVARIVGAELSRRLEQPFVVENRVGAGGAIAAEFVAKAPADGYTIFAATDAPLVINPHVYAKLPYDTLKDFSPISIIARSGFYMLVCPKLPVSKLQEFAALARKRQMSYASSGNGSNHHVVGEMLKQRGGFDMTHIPYKGASAALIDIMNCTVDTGFVAVGSIQKQVKSGADNIKPIAITTAQRDPQTPNIPTIEESGYPGVQMEAYYALLAPRATPKAIVVRLAAEVAEVMKTKEVRDRLTGIGLTIVASTPEEFEARLKADLAKYEKVVKEVNLKVQ